MDDHTLSVLEFPAVLARLAAHTSFSAGREAALALRPIVDRELVVRRQRQTGEAVHLRRMGSEVPMGGARDVRGIARGAARGQTLAASDLLDVASLVRTAMQAGRALTRMAEDAPMLAALGGGFADLGPLRSLIEEAIDEPGTGADQPRTARVAQSSSATTPGNALELQRRERATGADHRDA